MHEVCIEDVVPAAETERLQAELAVATERLRHLEQELETTRAVAAVLLGPRLQSGQQSRQPSTLARRGREPRLLPRPGERRPGPGVAVAPSRLLAQARYGRHEDIEDPDHAKGLIAQRSRAREQRLMMHFLALPPDAQAYYDGLEQRRLNARHHVRKILALAEIYPTDAVARAISDGLAFRNLPLSKSQSDYADRSRALALIA